MQQGEGQVSESYSLIIAFDRRDNYYGYMQVRIDLSTYSNYSDIGPPFKHTLGVIRPLGLFDFWLRCTKSPRPMVSGGMNHSIPEVSIWLSNRVCVSSGVDVHNTDRRNNPRLAP